MNNNFKFIKTEDNRFRWESDFMVLEYSEPSIQAFQEYLPVKDFKDIMYYYYTVKIFKKIDNSKEILVSERYVSDFPCIDELKWIIEHQLNNNPTINGQKIEYKHMVEFIREQYKIGLKRRKELKSKIRAFNKRIKKLQELAATQEIEYLAKEKQISTFFQLTNIVFSLYSL